MLADMCRKKSPTDPTVRKRPKLRKGKTGVLAWASGLEEVAAVIMLRKFRNALSETQTEPFGISGTFGLSDLSAERFRSIMLSVGV